MIIIINKNKGKRSLKRQHHKIFRHSRAIITIIDVIDDVITMLQLFSYDIIALYEVY